MVMSAVPWHPSRLRVCVDLSCLWFTSLSHLAEGTSQGSHSYCRSCSPGGDGTDTPRGTECQAEGQQCPHGQWDGDIQGFLTEGCHQGERTMNSGIEKRTVETKQGVVVETSGVLGTEEQV